VTDPEQVDSVLVKMFKNIDGLVDQLCLNGDVSDNDYAGLLELGNVLISCPWRFFRGPGQGSTIREEIRCTFSWIGSAISCLSTIGLSRKLIPESP
jgi:hypothetical protein